MDIAAREGAIGPLHGADMAHSRPKNVARLDRLVVTSGRRKPSGPKLADCFGKRGANEVRVAKAGGGKRASDRWLTNVMVGNRNGDLS